MSICRLPIFQWTSRSITVATQPYTVKIRTLCGVQLAPGSLSAPSRWWAQPHQRPQQPPLACQLLRRPLSSSGGAGGSATASNIVAIQDNADYDKRVRNNSEQPVLLQFHATWCAPCKMLRPRLEKAVRGRPKLLLATVDVDDLPDIAAEFRVASVPTVMAMQGGRVIDSFAGLKEPEAVQDFVDSFAEKQGV